MTKTALSKITLHGIRREDGYKNSQFQKLYEKLFSADAANLDENEIVDLLKWALFFFNAQDEGVRRLGYRIIVRYSNIFSDYVPLYDIALNAGFIPVSKFIEKKFLPQNLIEESFSKSYLSAYQNTFNDGKKFLSVGQKELVDFCTYKDTDYLIVAPTSYGKSELIISKVAENVDKRVCVLVPTKALLSQTKRRLLENDIIAKQAKRIITHPEMHREDDRNFVAALTQERLLRLIHTDPKFYVDVLLIDEAHNLLDGGERGFLLLQAILLLRRRNINVELKFYTPFLADSRSIETPYSNYKLDNWRVSEFIKIEKYHLYDTRNGNRFKLYDQFVDKYFDIDTLKYDPIEFVQAFKSSKNIVYLNRPKKVEEVALLLAESSPNIDLSSIEEDEFKAAYTAIAEFLHPDYKLLTCLKKGIIYHHGKIPDLIRLYIERLFSTHAGLTFVVTSSTLLEGVNIPAEKMFLLDVKKGQQLLSRSSFKNLVGRVCRFSEVFSEQSKDLRMLEPSIYIINSDFASKNFSPDIFFNKKVKWQDDLKDQDEVDNILLKKTYDTEEEVEVVRQKIEYIENIELGTIHPDKHNLDIRYVKSDIAKSCFRNNVNDFDIYENEKTLIKNISPFDRDQKISEPFPLLEAINDIFVSNILDDLDNELARLKYLPARKYYSLVLSWKVKGASFKEMIAQVVRHWQEKQDLAKSEEDYLVYVGRAWGEVRRTSDDKCEQYVDLRKKRPAQRVNIAIIRIKEELDFVDYNLMRYIEILNDLRMLDETFYGHIKYGSSDPKAICLLKNGFSNELTKCLLDRKYIKYLEFDLAKDMVKVSKAVVPVMQENGENRILIFELEFHTG